MGFVRSSSQSQRLELFSWQCRTNVLCAKSVNGLLIPFPRAANLSKADLLYGEMEQADESGEKIANAIFTATIRIP